MIIVSLDFLNAGDIITEALKFWEREDNENLFIAR